MTGPAILINGRPGESLSALDRGLLYGDGLFETMAVRDGVPQHWSRHIARLEEGCARLGIGMPDTDMLRDEADRLCRGVQRAVLKLIVTRGAGGRGYRAAPDVAPTRILQRHPFPVWPADYTAAGVRVRLCDLRLGHNPRLAGIKHLNRLEQVLARAEWDDPDINEGLLLDTNGHLIEGTMSNVFLVRDGVLLTPDLACCGVAGVTRALILELAGAAGIVTEVRDITMDDLAGADEVLLCNSLIGIWPVCRLENRTWQTGTLTRRLQDCLDEKEAGAR